MTSFPHNLVLDSQSRFGLTPSEFLNLNNFLINKWIFMKLVAKCSTSVCLSYQAHVKDCNPISLTFMKIDTNMRFERENYRKIEGLYLQNYSYLSCVLP